MKNIDVLKLDYKDMKTLKELGYKSSNYYRGPWGLMKRITKLRDFFKRFGIKFPFNPIYFIHDISYYKGGTRWHKMKVDFKMLYSSLEMTFTKPPLKDIKLRLVIQAIFDYLVVVLLTEYYIKSGKYNLKKKDE